MRHRKAIEMLYSGRCNVYEYVEEKDGNIINHAEKQVYKSVPCRLSYGMTYDGKRTSTDAVPGDNVSQEITLILSPDVDIKAGSKIEVTQNGRTVVYINSGQAAVYRHHQEIKLELYKEWC